MKYTISNGLLSVTADTLGAELVSVKFEGRERLWQNEDGSWARHAPVLFPVCGHVAMTVDGRQYPIAPHGFARDHKFMLDKRREDCLRFTLLSDEETKAVYPFEFRFSVEYRIKGATVEVKYEVENPADGMLYFCCGGHESYALDGELDGYKLVFEKPVRLTHSCTNANGYLSGETKDFGTQQELLLPTEVLQGGATLILGGIAAKSVCLCRKTGEKVAKLTFPDFENLLLWRPKTARMLCMEPWSNLPDRQGDTREFSEKEGVIKVAPHGAVSLTRAITYF